MYYWASVLATVMSQVNGLPPAHGNKVNPSDRLPSVRANPIGSLQTVLLLLLLLLLFLSSVTFLPYLSVICLTLCRL